MTKHMNIKLVDFSKQNKKLKRKLLENIEHVIDGQNYILGPEVEAFENSFSSYAKTKYAVGVASGYDAIMLSLKALGIGKGDEVITVANTYISSILPIIQTGAKPVLIDVHPESLLMDSTLIKKSITAKTRAILPVHLFGSPCDMDSILRISKNNNLFVIEDACQAHGTFYKNKPAGSMGDVGCFSFYPSKNLGAFGDGGMAITNNVKVAETLKILRNVGQTEKNVHSIIGYNSRLDSIQASILLTKIKYLESWVKKRRAIASFYKRKLDGLPIKLLPDPAYAYSSYHLFIIRTKYRDKLNEYLQSRGIHCGIHYPTPVHLQPSMRYLGYKLGDFPVSENSSREILSLPIYPELTFKEAGFVSKIIKTFFEKGLYH